MNSDYRVSYCTVCRKDDDDLDLIHPVSSDICAAVCKECMVKYLNTQSRTARYIKCPCNHCSSYLSSDTVRSFKPDWEPVELLTCACSNELSMFRYVRQRRRYLFWWRLENFYVRSCYKCRLYECAMCRARLSSFKEYHACPSSSLVASGKVQPCSRCPAMLERYQGCEQIMCSQCSTHQVWYGHP